MFFPRSFMVSGLTFKCITHFELISVYLGADFCNRVQKATQFHSFAYSCPVFPTLFIEEIMFSKFKDKERANSMLKHNICCCCC